MGPSGSGKSTLMHILAALDLPTTGYVTLAGTRLGDLSDTEITKLRRKHIGFIFQFFNLLPMLTAEENILLPLDRRRQARQGASSRSCSDASGSTDRALTPAVGAVRRPAAAGRRRARARREADRRLRRRADREPRLEDERRDPPRCCSEAVESYDQTMVMVTHDAKAATIADRVLFLADGLIVRDLGRADEEYILRDGQGTSR